MLKSIVGYNAHMIEHYGLSESQKGYLNGTKRLSNESKERKAITRKAFQTWSIMKPLVESKIVSDDFKYYPFLAEPKSEEYDRYDIPKDRYSFRQFLKALLKTDSRSPASKQLNKMSVAKMLIEESIIYYQTRFPETANELIFNKMKEFLDFIKMLQSIYDLELENLRVADFMRMRGGSFYPPQLTRDKFWHGYCDYCRHYDLGQAKSEEAVPKLIKHDENCNFKTQFDKATKMNDTRQIEYLIDLYIVIKTPKITKKKQ